MTKILLFGFLGLWSNLWLRLSSLCRSGLLGCNRLRLGSGGSFLVAVLKSQGSLSFFDLLLFAVPSLSDLFILYSHSCSWSKNICPVAKADLKGYHEAKGQESKAKLRAESLSRYSKLTVHFD